MAAAATPPAMPPICALLKLELLAAVTAVVLKGVLEVVLELMVVLDVNVDGTNVEVEFWNGRVVAALVVDVVDVVVVGVARTIDPDSMISVAISVACVSGAAPVWLLHIPYASVTA